MWATKTCSCCGATTQELKCSKCGGKADKIEVKTSHSHHHYTCRNKVNRFLCIFGGQECGNKWNEVCDYM